MKYLFEHIRDKQLYIRYISCESCTENNSIFPGSRTGHSKGERENSKIENRAATILFSILEFSLSLTSVEPVWNVFSVTQYTECSNHNTISYELDIPHRKRRKVDQMNSLQLVDCISFAEA